MEFSVKKVDSLPNQCGVYIFKGFGEYLYIGKSINIKARVKSHIESAKFNKKEKIILDKTQTIQFYLTENEFQAEVLEANLIKEYLPKYNVRWKDNKNFLYIKITVNDEYPKVFISRKNDMDNRNLYFGPFSSVKKTERLLNYLRKITPFCSQKELTKKPCFYSKIGLCNPCPSFINNVKNANTKKQLKAKYKENIKILIRLLKGKIKLVLNNLEKKLKKEIDFLKYEDAKETKTTINKLEELIKRRFISSEKIIDEVNKNSLNQLYELLSKYLPIKLLKRIEAYDVSNFQGHLATGAMIVLINGYFKKKLYRRFKIKNEVNDILMFKELINRRFSNKKINNPDLIVIDGGEPQLRIVKTILKEKSLKTPVIGIAKNPDRLVLNDKKNIVLNLDSSNKGFNMIKLIRDEAHRFANKYHYLLRKKNLFSKI